jgi:hypothetical protein
MRKRRNDLMATVKELDIREKPEEIRKFVEN